MKKNNKLQLTRQTLRHLDATKLRHVDGGKMKLTGVSECQDACTTDNGSTHCITD